MTLENIICEGHGSGEFSKSKSLYFWFTALRKLYIAVDDLSNSEEMKETAFILINLIEDNFKDANFKLLPRTTRLFLAVEQRNHNKAKCLLEQFPGEDEFLPYMILIPGTIFPFGSNHHSDVSATPLGNLFIL